MRELLDLLASLPHFHAVAIPEFFLLPGAALGTLT
jgi:hypothetical protein